MPRKPSPDKRSNPAQSKGRKALPDLPPRHAAFIDHFLIHFNGTRAARDAGFSTKGAAVEAHRLLRNPKVAAEITRRREETAAKLDDLSEARIKKEIASLAYSNMKDFAPMFGSGTPAEKLALLTREQGAVVQEIVVEEFRDGRSDWREVRRTKFKLNDKGRSLELLAKVSGMITEKVDHNHKHQGLIMHALLQEIDEAQRGKPIVDVLPPPPAKDDAA